MNGWYGRIWILGSKKDVNTVAAEVAAKYSRWQPSWLQVRDEYRKDYDPSRGGWGKVKEQQQGGRPAEDDDAMEPQGKPFLRLANVENQTSLGKRRRSLEDDGRLSPTEFVED